MMVAVSVLLAHIPVHGVNPMYLAYFMGQESIFSFMDSLSGGALSKMNMATFGVSSYISASIMMQLISVIIPRIDSIRRDGETGRRLYSKFEFFFAVFITIVNSTLLAVGFGRKGLLATYNLQSVLIAVASWVAGAVIITTLVKGNETHGVGNGLGLLLMINILKKLTSQIETFFRAYSGQQRTIACCILGASLILFFLVIIYLQEGMLKIPLIQSRKQAARSNSSGFLPIPVSTASVMPVIYTSSVLSTPAMIMMIFGPKETVWTRRIIELTSSINWYMPTKWWHIVGLLLYVLLLFVFASFASTMNLNAVEIEQTLRKKSEVIPGVNPGQSTVTYLERRREILSRVNVLFLMVLTMIPDFVMYHAGIRIFSYLGTSMMITASIIADTSNRIRAEVIHKERKHKLFGGMVHEKA